jgi:hypothetical protein
MISIASTEADATNLYPHTRYHRGFPLPMPRETIVSMACTLPPETGPFRLGVEDVETIAASILFAMRPLSDVARAQVEVIAEAARHEMGLDPWRAGRRGWLNQAVRGIARLAANDQLPLELRKQQVYLWLLGHPVFLDDWQPDPIMAMSDTNMRITYVRGPLWAGWERTPIACNHLGEWGVHPGAKSMVRWPWWKRRPRLSVDDTPEKMMKKILDASSF